MPALQARHTHAGDFAVEVERVHIGHARHVVEHRHQPPVVGGRVGLVLLRDAHEQLFGIGFRGVEHGFDQVVEQGEDDFVAAQFHVEHLGGAVYLLKRQGGARLVSGGRLRGQPLDERAGERARQDFLFVLHEHAGAFVHQLPHHGRAQVGNLLVHVGHHAHGVEPPGAALLVEEGEQQGLGLVAREDAQLVRVLDVHQLVADVVGGLDQIDERVAGIPLRVAGLADDAQLGGDARVGLALGGEEAELLLPLVGMDGGVGVFHDGCQRAVGEHEAARPAPVEAVGEQAEGVGVALEAGEVAPFLGAHAAGQALARPFGEVGGDGLLARMAERGVAHVVCQAGGGHDGPYLAQEGRGRAAVTLQQALRGVDPERASHAGHFQAVGEPVVHEHAAGQGEYLRLVLQPAEGG